MVAGYRCCPGLGVVMSHDEMLTSHPLRTRYHESLHMVTIHASQPHESQPGTGPTAEMFTVS
jgi:hypothetical protein